MRTALVITRSFPSSPQMVHGVFQRLSTQIAALGRVVDQVHCLFLTPVRDQYSPQQIRAYEEQLRQKWAPNLSITVAPVVRQSALKTLWPLYGAGVIDFHAQWIARVVNNPEATAVVAEVLDSHPDLVLAHRLSAMCILMRLKQRVGPTPVFFDLDDVEHLSLLRRLIHNPEWPAERLNILQVPRLMLAEMQAIRLSRRTFICSPADRAYLGRLVPRSRLQVVPNSIRIPPTAATAHSEPTVLFVGAMSYPPNALAADSLVRDIWPLVQAQVPEATLVIAGAQPELIPAYSAAPPGVTFTGFVDSLDGLYDRARVVCCPILYGAGTRIKIIEAAAYGRAVISTPLGAEGLDFEDGREILLAQGTCAIVRHCVQLLRDPERAGAIGAAARSKVCRIYDREAVVRQLQGLFAGGLRESVGSLQGASIAPDS